MWEKIGSIVAVVAAFVGAFVWMDEHYASAADLKKLEDKMSIQILDLRKRDLDAKIFELEYKKNEKPAEFKAMDKAVLERHKRELTEINQTEKNR